MLLYTLHRFILIIAPSGIPENILVRVLTSTNIRVSWEEVSEVERHGVITEYEIMVEQLISFGERNSESIIVDSRNLSIILMDLEEYMEYNISVRAYTSVGPGPYSVGIVRRTLEDGKSLFTY